MTSKRKHVCLSIKEKLEIIKSLEVEGNTVTSLSKKYNVGKATICGIRKNQTSILSYTTASNLFKKRKTMKISTFPEVDKAVYTWLLQQKSRGGPISGEILCEKALFFYGLTHNDDNFKASSGWLGKFKNRYGIQQLPITGEKLSSIEAIIEPDMNILDQSSSYKEVDVEPDIDVLEHIQNESSSNNKVEVIPEHVEHKEAVRSFEMCDESKPKKKHVALSIKDKIEIIKSLDVEGNTVTSLAKKYNVSKSTICDIKKNKMSILSYGNTSSNLNKKRNRSKIGAYPEVDKAVYTWFLQQRSRGVPISRTILRDKALFFYSQTHNDTNFKASTGWLYLFKNRYGIRQLPITGELVSSDEAAVAPDMDILEPIQNESSSYEEVEVEPDMDILEHIPNESSSYKVAGVEPDMDSLEHIPNESSSYKVKVEPDMDILEHIPNESSSYKEVKVEPDMNILEHIPNKSSSYEDVKVEPDMDILEHIQNESSSYKDVKIEPDMDILEHIQNESRSYEEVEVIPGHVKHKEAVRSFETCLKWAEENDESEHHILFLSEMLKRAKKAQEAKFKQS